MIDSIIIKHLENDTFRETTIYKDGTSLIEIFDDGILISSEEFNSYPPKIITDMLNNIKPRQGNLQTYEDDNIDEFVDARQFFCRLIRKHNS
jgi:hypothetical protein